ncbi:MAG: hypothetical protein JNJ53_05580 [Rhizobiales bacterium]|nr:hypothetical protein [Hyphomicrobiales bacterium]
MKSILNCTVAVSLFAASIAPAWADGEVVEISEMQGKVLVNAGNGYAPVPDMALLNEGDTVMVGDDSSAIIVYIDSKCRVRLPAHTVTTISLPDPCKSAAIPPPSGASLASQPLVWVGLGALVFAGGIAYLIANHDNEEGNPPPVSNP